MLNIIKKDFFMFTLGTDGHSFMKVPANMVTIISEDSFSFMGDTFTKENTTDNNGYTLTSKLYPRMFVKIANHDWMNQ